MRNQFRIEGDITYIITSKGEFIIDTQDLGIIGIADFSWQIDERGYVIMNTYCRHDKDYVHRNKYRVHRVIMGCPDELVIDHIDGNKLNNKRSNLRICTQGENNQNLTKLRTNNSTGYRGVYYNKKLDKYTASVSINKKRVYLGAYETAEEANQKAIEARGELMTHSFEAVEKNK
jgi:hypothetical protein